MADRLVSSTHASDADTVGVEYGTTPRSTGRAAMPNIYWLIKAQRRFLQAMTPAGAANTLAATFTKTSARLAATFPKARAVIVRDRLRGYRNRRDRHILLVEVIHRTRSIPVEPEDGGSPDGDGDGGTGCTIIWPGFCEPKRGEGTQTSAHIVKIADVPKVLSDELDAWERCRPVGMEHDSILMRLRPGAQKPNGELVSIIYEDAHHVIGAGQVIALEKAVLDCCLYETPTVASIELLIRVLYEHFGEDFYTRSWVIEEPKDNLARLRAVGKDDKLRAAWEKFDSWLKQWQDKLEVGNEPQLDRLKIRREVLAVLSYRRNCLIDPVDYLRSVQECPEYCPLLLWGCSHGDVHGHNVLVSVLDDAVTLPAVYDYGDMGLENLVGWDFVKLETELKVRVLPQVLDGTEADYLFTVLKFECFLASYCNAMHNQWPLPRAEFKQKGLNRLASIILAIRRQAQRHLGDQRLRDRQWLEEYYFLLACYGVYAGLFDTYKSKRRQLAAAYISAGVAARQLARPTLHLDGLIRDATVRAKGLIESPPKDFDPEQHSEPRAECEMSYHVRLAFAKKWIDSNLPPYINGAITILVALRKDYPHVLEIEDELALAYLEARPADDFNALLRDVRQRYDQLSEEFLCRIGRFWKDQGDAERTADLEGARRLYENALDWYRQAFTIRGNYYPGINLAALAFVAGKFEQAKQTAEALLQSLAGSPPAEELIWIRATQADAQVLLENHGEAERLYRLAKALSDPRDLAAMRRQLELLLAYAPLNSSLRAYWTPDRLDKVFGP
jgi:hypothetical protein